MDSDGEGKLMEVVGEAVVWLLEGSLDAWSSTSWGKKRRRLRAALASSKHNNVSNLVIVVFWCSHDCTIALNFTQTSCTRIVNNVT